MLQNSNLVLTAETRTREATEPSGEPETLWGRMPGKMGDRVQHGKPEELRKTKPKKKYAASYLATLTRHSRQCSRLTTKCDLGGDGKSETAACAAGASPQKKRTSQRHRQSGG